MYYKAYQRVTILACIKMGKRIEQEMYLALPTVKLGFSSSTFQHATNSAQFINFGHILFATFVQVKFRYLSENLKNSSSSGNGQAAPKGSAHRKKTTILISGQDILKRIELKEQNRCVVCHPPQRIQSLKFDSSQDKCPLKNKINKQKHSLEEYNRIVSHIIQCSRLNRN